MPADERVLAMGAEATAPIRLSVLIPFHRHDPCRLLAQLGRPPAGLEFVLLDDGSASAGLLADVIAAAERLHAPARIVVWGANRGRAAARNRLIEEARGEYVLFLDADMLPDSPWFLRTWLGVLSTQTPWAAFGGLSVKDAPHERATALHRHLLAKSDCAPARRRALRPGQSTASANLAVRRELLSLRPFDPDFVGWGFEDTDWALSVSERVRILHVDNPATHAGLDDVAALMRKCAEAGPNFARLARKHRRAVRRFAAYRTARVLQCIPGRAPLRRLARALAAAGFAPMPLRRAAFKLYRASHFAEHLA